MSFSRNRARAVSALGVLTAGAALAFSALSAPAQAATAAATTAPQYTLTITRSPGLGQQTSFFGINANGDIFGSAIESGSPSEEGFLLKAGSTTLQFLGSPGDPGNTKSIATPDGLNVADDIAGSSQSLTNSMTTPLLWPNSSTPSSLASLPAIAALLNPQATAINDSNLIAGDGSNGHGTVPFTIQGSQVTMLPALPGGGDSQPAAVSNAGVIVGQADSATISPVAVEWQNGAIRQLGKLPGGLTSEALAVNTSGEIVGASLAPGGDAHAVLFANGTVTDLNVPGTGQGDAQADGVNDSGVIVGDGGNGHAFIYQNGQATDLNSLISSGSGFTLVAANGINNKGDIVGTAVSNAQPRQSFGFELTPVS
jgi:probable HAF family extracellular repeat protein